MVDPELPPTPSEDVWTSEPLGLATLVCEPVYLTLPEPLDLPTLPEPVDYLTLPDWALNLGSAGGYTL